MIDKDSFFAALKPKAQPFEVKGLGVVQIAQLTVGQVEALRATVESRKPTDTAEKPKGYDFGLCLLCACVQDETGANLFTGADVDQLVACEQSAVEALITQCLSVNNFIASPDAKN